MLIHDGSTGGLAVKGEEKGVLFLPELRSCYEQSGSLGKGLFIQLRRTAGLSASYMQQLHFQKVSKSQNTGVKLLKFPAVHLQESLKKLFSGQNFEILP